MSRHVVRRDVRSRRTTITGRCPVTFKSSRHRRATGGGGSPVHIYTPRCPLFHSELDSSPQGPTDDDQTVYSSVVGAGGQPSRRNSRNRQRPLCRWPEHYSTDGIEPTCYPARHMTFRMGEVRAIFEMRGQSEGLAGRRRRQLRRIVSCICTGICVKWRGYIVSGCACCGTAWSVHRRCG